MIKKLLERFRFLFSTPKYRRKIWPTAPKLSSVHIRNCRLVPDRFKMLERMPKNGVCAELGIWKGDFSREILKHLAPATLHLIDIDPVSIRIAREKFSKQISGDVVKIHEGDSSEILLSMPDRYFDWIYIDGDHSYTGAKKDLEASHRKLKETGLISLNDYIYFGSSDLYKYGVIEAVNEFCITHNYEIIYLALHGRMYNDVTLRRIQ